MLRVIIVGAAITSLIALPLAAQKARPQSGTGPIELSVKQLNDRRGGQFFERLQLVVELPGVASGDLSGARVLLRSAVDDTGRNLLDPDAGEPGLETIAKSPYEDADDRKKPATVSFSLVSPARTATSVKEIAGEIELYMPSKDPNSSASVPKFLSFKGKLISHKALKANGVEISLVSDQQFEAEKKRQAELKRKEMIKEEYPEDIIASSIESFLEYFPKPEPNDVVLRIKDPKSAIQSVSYIDASGEEKRGFLREDEGFMFLSNWEGPPEAGWSLRVDMKTAKSLIRRPFVLADVPLP